MNPGRRSAAALGALCLASIALLSACSGSGQESGATSEAQPEEAPDAAPVEEDAPAEAAGAMTDASFAVTTYMDTIWPIEGNDYADAAAVEPWCATHGTDPAGAIDSVVEYLSQEPDIAGADPESVRTAIDEYLTNNCYLIQ